MFCKWKWSRGNFIILINVFIYFCSHQLKQLRLVAVAAVPVTQYKEQNSRQWGWQILWNPFLSPLTVNLLFDDLYQNSHSIYSSVVALISFYISKYSPLIKRVFQKSTFNKSTIKMAYLNLTLRETGWFIWSTALGGPL